MIGELLTIGDVTGHVIRMEDPETVVLFDGKKNHSLKLADTKVMQHDEEKQICTKCAEEKPINEFRQFKNERRSKMCDDCRGKNTNAGTIKTKNKRVKVNDKKLEEPITQEFKEIEIDVNNIAIENPISIKQPKTKIEDVLLEKSELYYKKNADYGNSFETLMDEYGLIALAIRLSDKLNRLKQLSKTEQQVMNESIQDTLIDISNYADMGIMWLRNKEDINV